jgi:hypothetical protein
MRDRGPESIAALICRVPVLADAISGVGPFAIRPYWGGSRPRSQTIDDVTALADYLDRDTPTTLRVMCANRIEHQLLVMASIDGGMLDQATTHRILGLQGDRRGKARIERAVSGLHDLMLADPGAGWCTLIPGVAERLSLPGVTFRQSADAITREVLVRRARTMQLDDIGTRKFEVVDAIEAALRDPAWFASALQRLGEPARELLGAMIGKGVMQVSVTGTGYFGPSWSRRNPRIDGRLYELVDSGFVGVDEYDQLCWSWLDLELAIHGGNPFADWTEPDVSTRPISEPAAIAIPPAMSAIDTIVNAFATTPVKALKTGGLGTAAVRSIAKSLRRTSAEVGLLASIAIELGLIGLVVVEQRGRGRNLTVDRAWQPDPERTAPWHTLPAWARYARIVQQWLDSLNLPVDGQPIERYGPYRRHHGDVIARRTFVEVLTAHAPGHGFELGELTALMEFRYPLWFATETVAQLVAEARVLGLIPADGPIGLTPTARQVLADAPGLGDALAGSPTAFTVQADHTVIAPPGLDPDLDAMLARIAVLESDAGARVYRITDTSIASALDHGLDLDAILEFVRDHSAVEVAPNVKRTIVDAAERHRRLRIGTAATWIACDDPIQLARAIAVKAAKLIAVTPTAAVSPLAEDKVLTALRAKGVTPARDSESRASTARMRRSNDPRDLGPRRQLLTDLSGVDDTAKRLAAAPTPRRAARGISSDALEAAFAGDDEFSDDFAAWDDEFE